MQPDLLIIVIPSQGVRGAAESTPALCPLLLFHKNSRRTDFF